MGNDPYKDQYVAERMRNVYAAFPALPVPHGIDPCGNEVYTRQQLLDFGLMCLKQQSMFEEMERRGL